MVLHGTEFPYWDQAVVLGLELHNFYFLGTLYLINPPGTLCPGESGLPGQQRFTCNQQTTFTLLQTWQVEEAKHCK